MLRSRGSSASLVILIVSVLAAACGEAGLLDGLGSHSQEVIYADTTTTTTIIVQAGTDRELGAKAAVNVEWFNDVIEKQYAGEPSYVIDKVWQRTSGLSRFVQASRFEISQAMPDIRFPSLVPDGVGWITSQLVFDTSSATLDPDTAAAFGMWGVEPYSVPDGQLAVLRVGLGTEAERSQPFEIRADVVDDGISLNWVTGRYRYELFCRQSLPEDLCWQMAETNRLLAAQLRGDVDAGLQADG